MGDKANQGGRFLLSAASLVIVIAGLRAAGSLILPILLAGFLAVLSSPLQRWFRRRGIGVAISVLLTVLAVFAVLAVFTLMFSAAVAEAGAAAPQYIEQLQESARAARSDLQDSALAEYVSLEQVDPASLVEIITSTFGGLVRGTVVGVATAFSWATLILLATVFMLVEGTGFIDKLRLATQGRGDVDLDQFRQITRELQHYLGIKTIVSVGTGLTIFCLTWIVGLDFPLFWGLSAFLLNYIPTLGSIIAGVPATILAAIQHGPGMAGFVAFGYLAVNVGLGSIVEPRLMGLRFRLSTLVVFLSLLFWGFIWGPLGMLLSVPLTRTLVIVVENITDDHWLPVLLGRNPRPTDKTADSA
ncbi:MAG: AI-2E family transporter [Acidimicrobiia bacterium]